MKRRGGWLIDAGDEILKRIETAITKKGRMLNYGKVQVRVTRVVGVFFPRGRAKERERGKRKHERTKGL